MSSQHFSTVLVLLILVLSSLATSASAAKAEESHAPIQLVRDLADASHYDAIIDTRPLASCQQSSVKGAMCLPVEDVLAPNRRLANWSGMLWLLGSANLTGSEHVLIVGYQASRRQFIAGLLFLAGQRRVSVLDMPVSELIEKSDAASPGGTRATTRTRVYTALMRSESIVLRNELESLVSTSTAILDGRSEGEYFGVRIRGTRGGHIPGAINSPGSDWLGTTTTAELADVYRSTNPVVYAHDTFDSLVYLATLRTAGINARVYLAGWVEWASNAALPADSVTYPDAARLAQKVNQPEQSNSGSTPAAVTSNDGASNSSNQTGLISAAAMLIICLLVASFYTGRKFAGKAV